MNLRYISKYEESKKDKLIKDKELDMKSFAKKELFTLTEKHLTIPVFIMKL